MHSQVHRPRRWRAGPFESDVCTIRATGARSVPWKGTVMKLTIDISRVQFTVTKAVAEKNDQNGKQKTDRISGAPLWVTQVMALDESGGEMLTITTAGQPPKVNVGQSVVPVELEAIPWATNGRNGTAFRATSLNVAGSAGVKAAA